MDVPGDKHAKPDSFCLLQQLDGEPYVRMRNLGVLPKYWQSASLSTTESQSGVHQSAASRH